MYQFPAVDPIPLPAPVLFFKVLHSITLTFHFLAVHLLIGGLIFGAVWMVLKNRRDVFRDASGALAYRLPNIMAFVVNFAIPPLLFTQVLYGRMLFTSSILIGTWWILVIVMLIFTYGLLYYSNQMIERKKFWWWVNLVGLLIVLVIALIYTNNMTLMLRPEAWQEMYQSSPSGIHLASSDPTILPRWLFMISGSLMIGGIGLILMSLSRSLQKSTTDFLRVWGARIGAAFCIIHIGAGYLVFSSQPDNVREALIGHSFYGMLPYIWLSTIFFIFLLMLIISLAKNKDSKSLTIAASIFGILNVGIWVLIRDGIRDITLNLKGLDIWDRTVVVNLSAIIIFLILFLAAFVAVGWMIFKLAGARKVKEDYA